MPNLNEYIDQQPLLSSRAVYKSAVTQAVRLAVDPGHDMWVQRTDAECRAIFDTVVLRPGNGYAGSFKFIGFTQAQVDELGVCLGLATAMLTRARQQVGQHTWPGKSNYERFFGSRAWHGQSAARKAANAAGPAADASGFALRSAYVRNKITQIIADLQHADWLVKNSETAPFAAAAKGLGDHFMEIGREFPLGVPGYLHAGVLIHEVGHNVGLADVCDSCNPRMVGFEHFTPTADPNIRQCRAPGHGDDGHFINKDRVALLAQKHKNATIYNADSYRYYCYEFFLSQVRAEHALHVALAPVTQGPAVAAAYLVLSSWWNVICHH